MKEVFWRERAEKTASMSLMAQLVGRGLGLPPEDIAEMLSSFTDVVSQNRYTPQAAAERRKRISEAARQKKADKSLLEKVDKLTVPDEELAPLPKRGRKRSRR